jgi:hypothetical protein
MTERELMLIRVLEEELLFHYVYRRDSTEAALGAAKQYLFNDRWGDDEEV